jgi:hypothetical protein
MAFGKHWEWRGFGTPRGAVLDTVRGLPLLFDRPQEVVDRYLWSPGCDLNLKLRFGDFKIKRLVDRGSDGVEEWLENAKENYSFPIDGLVLEEVALALGVDGVSAPDEEIATAEDLVQALRGGASQVSIIDVDKLRWQHAGPEGGAAIIEYAEIRAPETIVSIGVEDEDEGKIRATLEKLGLPGDLRTASYLDALDIWGAGGRLSAD